MTSLHLTCVVVVYVHSIHIVRVHGDEKALRYLHIRQQFLLTDVNFGSHVLVNIALIFSMNYVKQLLNYWFSLFSSVKQLVLFCDFIFANFDHEGLTLKLWFDILIRSNAGWPHLHQRVIIDFELNLKIFELLRINVIAFDRPHVNETCIIHTLLMKNQIVISVDFVNLFFIHR